MVTTKIYDRLSAGAKKELSQLVDGKENAFDMLVNNLYGKAVYSSDEICSRMQMQYFALNPDENTLQQDGKNGWWQNEAYEMSNVNVGLTPVIEVEGDFEKWGEAYYSSFALCELDGNYNLRYPLDDDYTSSVEPFKNLSMSDVNYNVLVRQIQNNLKVKIARGKVASKNVYKRSFPSLALAKIKNTALRLSGRQSEIQTMFKGTLTLADKTTAKYKYSNIEKAVKIYDELFKIGIAKQVKYSKGQFKGADRDIKFASRIFADILMARITDFGNKEINKKVEKCLSLQFANVLNRAGFGSDELQTITTLGSNVVVDTCKSMGITTQRLIQKMVSNGYQYQQLPTNELEAILFAKEKDYSQYLNLEQNLENTKNTAKILALPAVNTASLELNAAKVSDSLPSGRENHPSLSGIEKRKELASGKSKLAVLAAGKQDAQPLPASKYEGMESLSAPQIAGLLPTRAEDGKFSSVKPLLSGNMYNSQTMADRLLQSLPEEIKQQQLAIAKSNYEATIDTTKTVTRKTVEKLFDKTIIKLLSEKVVGINTKLNAHRYSAVGGKEDGQKNSDIYSQVLSYYTNSVNSKKVLSDGKDTTTLYSKTKKLSERVVDTKNRVIDKIMGGQEAIKRDASEPTSKFINRRVKEITSTRTNPDGLTIKDFFKKYLERLPRMYDDLESKKEKNTKSAKSEENLKN